MAERRAAMIEAYRTEDATVIELAARFGIKPCTFSRIISKAGATDPTRLSRSTRLAWARGSYANARFSRGRRAVWPDCPPEIAPLYRKLRNNGIPAREARAVLERSLAA